MSLIFIPKLPSVSFTTDRIVSNVRVVTLSAEHLQPVVPSRGDKVKVILGDEDKDQTGQLLSIDSQVLIVVINLYPSSFIFRSIYFKYLLAIQIILKSMRIDSSSEG